MGRPRPGAGPGPRRGRFRPLDRPPLRYSRMQFRPTLLTARQRFLGPSRPPRISPRRGPRISPRSGPLIPPLMGPPTPPLMGPPGGGGPAVAGLGSFPLVRTLAGQGHGQKPPVTLPRYATLESVWPIESPSMGLLRRPPTGGIVEDGRLSRPCGPGAHSRASEKPVCGFAAIPSFHPDVLCHSPSCSSMRGGRPANPIAPATSSSAPPR
jgi:hypothetical protein